MRLVLSMLLLTLLCAAPARAQLHLDFETTGQLQNTIVGGDTALFTEAPGLSHGGGSKALKFSPPATQSYRSFTYDEPTGMTTGTITIWFYDVTGSTTVLSPLDATWGLSIILEDADNPSDFGAVEICDLPYGATRPYYATEGSVNRLTPQTFDSSLPMTRSLGWHRVDFTVGQTITLISVDGAPASRCAAPGGEKNLRLRFMADSASVGGFSNWTTNPGPSYPAAPGKVYIDDIAFAETFPAAETRTLGFEGSGATADYDIVSEFMGPTPHSEPLMSGFVNTFDIGTTTTHAGTGAAVFANGTPPLQSLTFDLAGLDSSTTQTATVWFHDALGAEGLADKLGGAIILEDGSNPANFIALEIWNFPYPFDPGIPNYYLTARPFPSGNTGNGSGFYSRYFGDRSIGWHKVEIVMNATSSRILVDGIENANGLGRVTGPGLNANPRLRIMADSPSMGGSDNYASNALWLDPTSPELNILYLTKDADYVRFDDITLPLAVTATKAWMVYE